MLSFWWSLIKRGVKLIIMGEDLTKLERLPKRYQLFADGIIEHGHITKAARDAGYAERSAHVQGSRLMKHVKIKAYLAQVSAISSANTGVSNEYVISTLKEMVERCMQKAKVLDKKGDQVYIETASGDVVPAYTFNSAGAAKGLELIGKHLGTFDKDKAKEDERPAFVGISINMGEGTVKMVTASGGSVEGALEIGPPENVKA